MHTRTHESIVNAQFDPQAPSYLASAVHSQGEDLLELGRLVAGRGDAAALDLGCGAGHVTFALAPQVHSVVAYDLSAAMLAATAAESARRGYRNVTVREGVVERLPFDAASFDIVACRYSAHHWREVAAGLREVRRVLKPGGMAVFMDLTAPDVPLLDTWLQSMELLRDRSHVRNLSLAQWCAKLGETGLQPQHVRCFRVRLEFGPWVSRMNTPEPLVRAIRVLQADADDETLRHFAIESDGSFTVDSMLIGARG